MVFCRAGRSCGPPASTGSRRSSRASSAAGGSSRNRAAASSMASGSPSSRRQIPATARAVVGVRRAAPSPTARPVRASSSHRWRAPLRLRRAARVRQRQRRDRVVAPAPDVQRHPAGDQHDHARTRLQQREHGVPGRQQVLEVVQQHQQPPAAQRHRQQVGQRGRVPLVHPQPPGDGAQHQPRVAQRRQVDEDDAVGEVTGHPLRPPRSPAGSCPPRPGPVSVSSWVSPRRSSLTTAAATPARPISGVSGRGMARAGYPVARPAACRVTAAGRAAASSPARSSGPRPARRRAASPCQPRGAVRIPLQVADGLGAEPGPLGQGLLGQARRQPCAARRSCTEPASVLPPQKGEYSGSARPVARPRPGRAAEPGSQRCPRKS